MVFSSIPFLFVFLLGVLAAYFLADRFFPRARNLVLLVFSFGFYAIGEPKYALLMVLTITIVYAAGRWIGARRGTPAGKWLLYAGCTVPLVFLAFFKYTDFLLGTVNSLFGVNLPLLRLVLPVGISFYTFQAISYVIDVYRDDVPVQKSWIDLATYVVLFPQLIAGPIVRCKDVARELQTRTSTMEGFANGVRRFTFGLGKKVLLANQLDMLCTACREDAALSVLGMWLYAIGFTLQIYLDFSGYSDMAIGLGQVFGFRFPENFNYPYISRSVTEFWRRWHMTLGGWFRDYVYIPLGGNRVSKAKHLRNIFVVWGLTGIWHGAGWNFLIWGLWYGVLLAIEKLWLLKKLDKAPAVLQHIYTLFTVVIGFVIFNAADMSTALLEIGGMFGLRGLPLVTESALYTLQSFAVLLAMSIIASTPLCKRLVEKLEKTPVPALLEAPATALILVLCTAWLVDGSFNPFLYFRF
ncbi:MAG: MBOAT family protein [Clostridia bacterium]|nr:MBOAT family protein [Clostridia bacterium]